MKDPVRWLDDGAVTQSVRSVLAAADPVPCMPEAVQAHLAAQCAALAAQGVAAHSAAGSAWAKLVASSMVGNTVKGVVFATLVGTAGTAGYYVFREPAGKASPAASQPPARARSLATSPRLPADAARSRNDETTGEIPALAASSDAPRFSVPRKTKEAEPLQEPMAADPELQAGAAVSVAAFENPSIADEARLLEKARAALVANPARALQLVQQHERLHPNGQLYAEREFIAVAALLRLGRRQEALQRAEPRLKQAPDSLYSKRLRKLLDSDSP